MCGSILLMYNVNRLHDRHLIQGQFLAAIVSHF